MDQSAIPLLSSFLCAIATYLATGSLPHVWDKVTAAYIADLTPSIRALGMDEAKLPLYLRLWTAFLIAILALLIVVFRMIPIVLPALYLGYITPRLWLGALIGRRRTLIRDQLVGATVGLANTARAGMSLAQGIESVAKESPQPLAAELRRIVSDYNGGLPLAKAIRSVKERLQVDSFTLFSAAVLTCLERGGRITDALDRISYSLQENQRIERKLESETASGRKVVRLLIAFPFVFLGFFALVYHPTMLLFTSIPGQLVLVLVIGLVFISARWSNKILNTEI